MGCFSFTRADLKTSRGNFLSYKDKVKLLIPREYTEHYGKPYFKAVYEDYGHIYIPHNDEVIEFDLYGYMAYINRDMPMPKEHHFFVDSDLLKSNPNGVTVGDYYKIEGDGGFEDTNIQTNREIGIALCTDDSAHSKCTHKLKLASASFNGLYEDCEYFSLSDPNQGWTPLSWNEKIHNDFLPQGEKYDDDRDSMPLANYIMNYCMDVQLVNSKEWIDKHKV